MHFCPRSFGVQAATAFADRNTVGASAHLRGIVIAGGLAALALALGFMTLVMNQTPSQAGTHTVLSLKARHHTMTTKNGTKVHVVKRVDPNLTAALQAGLPRSVAKGLAAKPVVVVELTSREDSVAQLALGEAKAGALDGGAAFVAVNVDNNGGDVQTLTRLLGSLPTTPAALIYTRPATLYVTLAGFNDRVTVEQAVENASPVKVAAASNWATSADALCAQLSGQIKATPETTANVPRVWAYELTFLGSMKALTPPAGQVAQIKQLNVLLVKNASQVRGWLVATASGNTKAAATAKAAINKSSPKIKMLSQKLGAPSCAKVV